MKIDVARESRIADRLGNCEEDLRTLMKNLEGYKASLEQNWQGTEVNHVRQAFEQLNQEISKLLPQFQSLRSEVITVATAIRREEDEKEASEEAKRQQQAKQG